MSAAAVDYTGQLYPQATWRAELTAADSRLPAIARHAGLTLSLYLPDVGVPIAFPSVRTIARRMGRDERTARRALRILEAEGWLELLAVGGGKGHTNHWRATLPARMLDGGDGPPKGGHDDRDTAAKGGDVSPLRREPGQAAPLSGPKGGDAAPLYGPKGGDMPPENACISACMHAGELGTDETPAEPAAFGEAVRRLGVVREPLRGRLLAAWQADGAGLEACVADVLARGVKVRNPAAVLAAMVEAGEHLQRGAADPDGERYTPTGALPARPDPAARRRQAVAYSRRLLEICPLRDLHAELTATYPELDVGAVLLEAGADPAAVEAVA